MISLSVLGGCDNIPDVDGGNLKLFGVQWSIEFADCDSRSKCLVLDFTKFMEVAKPSLGFITLL